MNLKRLVTINSSLIDNDSSSFENAAAGMAHNGSSIRDGGGVFCYTLCSKISKTCLTTLQCDDWKNRSILFTSLSYSSVTSCVVWMGTVSLKKNTE